MRTFRRALAGATLGTSLLVALPGAGLAQETAITYTEGAAQLLVRGGTVALDTFALTSGVRDAATGRLTLRYRQPDGKATLTIVTPSIPGAHAAAPRPPRGAAVTYRKVHRLSGARAACTIAWSELTPTSVSGSYSCPRERKPGKRGRYSVVGAFTARAVPEVGAVPTTDPMPVYAAGVPVEIEGVSVAPTAFTDLAGACVKSKGKGKGKGSAGATPCAKGQVNVPGALRAIELRVCVAAGREVAWVLERGGYSRMLFAGTPDAPLALGMPVVVSDPAVTTAAVRRAVNPDGCVEGHAIAGTQGPLVVWTPPNGAAPVAWTLDPLALPPTAEAPEVGPGTAPASPSPVASPMPAGRTTFATGAADLLHDGTGTLAADDLVLEDGWLERDGAGGAHLHLAFASPSGSVTIDLPGGEGSYAFEAGAATADQALAYTLPGVAVAAGETGCRVDVVATPLGGVEGGYVCTTTQGANATGAFIANP